VPKGAVAMQLGAEVPEATSGIQAQSPAVPPYPATPEWWLGQESNEALNDVIWMPDLPKLPPTTRSSTGFGMPMSFGCTVFFPGYYPDPLIVPQGRVYFASGVYYFEDTVTFSGNIDAVVGYGLEDFVPASDCADDIQAAANVTGDPVSFDINGGGATWVFGANGKLLIDDTTTTTDNLRVRFNQRYADADRGGRISIMTVNGDDASSAEHFVTDVNQVPRSFLLNDTSQIPIDGSGYVPSNSTFTDKARLPEEVQDLAGLPFQEAGVDPNRGAVLLSWDESVGQLAGGALLGERDTVGWITEPYDVEVRPESGGPWVTVCPPEELVVGPQAVPADGNEISCTVRGLQIGTDYRLRVRATNEVGDGPWRRVNVTPDGASPPVSPPDAPTNVQALDGVADDTAQVTWDAPTSNGGAPIVGYRADAYRIEHLPQPNLPPVAPDPFTDDEHVDIESGLLLNHTQVIPVRASDPNGDPLTLSIDTSGLPGGLTATANPDNTITVISTPFTPTGFWGVPYTVTDDSGLTASGEMRIDVVPLFGILPHDPIADQLDLAADLGVPIRSRLPISDAEATPFSSIVVDTASATPALGPEWTVNVIGEDVEITTTAPDGTYDIPYTVTDPTGRTASNIIRVTIAARQATFEDSCTVVTDPLFVTPTACEMPVLDRTPGPPESGDQGYRFDVVAINAVGESAPGTTGDLAVFSYGPGGVGLLPPPTRIVEPWIPEPVVDIQVTGTNPVEVAIAGYVATPMGRLHVDNQNSQNIRLNGGVLTGTFDLDDARDTGPASLPIGFKNDIVLQRRVRITSVAGNVTSTADVQLNEDGAGFAVNSWVVG